MGGKPATANFRVWQRTKDKTTDGSPGSAVSNSTMQQPSTLSDYGTHTVDQEFLIRARKLIISARNQCSGSGSGIRIRDPGFGSFWIRDRDRFWFFFQIQALNHIFESIATKKFEFFGYNSLPVGSNFLSEGKTTNFWDSRSGPGWIKLKIRIRDKHPGSATLRETRPILKPSARI